MSQPAPAQPPAGLRPAGRSRGGAGSGLSPKLPAGPKDNQRQAQDGGSNPSPRRRRRVPAGGPTAALPKGATFHTSPTHSKNEGEENGQAGPGAPFSLRTRSSPATLRRAPSAPSTRDEVVAAGERRMAAILDSFEPELATLNLQDACEPTAARCSSPEPTAQPTRSPRIEGSPLNRVAPEDDLPLPRGILDARIPPTNPGASDLDTFFATGGPNHKKDTSNKDKLPERNLANLPPSDSGLGSSIAPTHQPQSGMTEEQLQKQQHYLNQSGHMYSQAPPPPNSGYYPPPGFSQPAPNGYPVPGQSYAAGWYQPAPPNAHHGMYYVAPGTVRYSPAPGSVASRATGSVKRAQHQQPEEDVYRSMGRRKKNAPKEPPIIPCTECPRTFERKCDLDKHIKTHDRPWKCPEDGCQFATKGFPTQKEMERHWDALHNPDGPKFPCNVEGCIHVATRESNLKQHKEKRHNIPYERTKGARAVRNHRMSHSSGAPSTAASVSPPNPPTNVLGASPSNPPPVIGFWGTPTNSASPGPSPPNPPDNNNDADFGNFNYPLVTQWNAQDAPQFSYPTPPNPSAHTPVFGTYDAAGFGFGGAPPASTQFTPANNNHNNNAWDYYQASAPPNPQELAAVSPAPAVDHPGAGPSAHSFEADFELYPQPEPYFDGFGAQASPSTLADSPEAQAPAHPHEDAEPVPTLTPTTAPPGTVDPRNISPQTPPIPDSFIPNDHGARPVYLDPCLGPADDLDAYFAESSKTSAVLAKRSAALHASGGAADAMDVDDIDLFNVDLNLDAVSEFDQYMEA